MNGAGAWEEDTGTAWLAALERRDGASGARELRILDASGAWSPSLAWADGCRVAFDGELYNAAELHASFADSPPDGSGDAHLVARAYRRWGEDALRRLKGVFALVVWDGARQTLVCARDPLGVHPLFYAETARSVLVSPSIETLVRAPGVSGVLNRAGLVDYLSRRWLKRDETCFADVRRVLPGHVVQIDAHGRRSHRYWDPLPPERTFEWIPDDEAQERFGPLLEQAIVRRLAPGPSGIYLSGGLDSAAVATMAADICRRERRVAPLGLSVVFPAPYEEDATVRGVASALGMPTVLLPFEEAAGAHGILAAALELSRMLPSPMFNIWAPAYVRLSLAARQRGCQVILTGEGGDEWLGVPPVLAADLLRSLDLPHLYRLWRSLSRSYPSVSWASLHGLLWRFGLRPLLVDAWYNSAARRGARGLVRRSRATANAAGTRPWIAPEPWIAPDPALRAQVASRVEESRVQRSRPAGDKGFYLQDIRSRLDAPSPWLRMEESFLLGRHTGVWVHDPLWDADLIELLLRVRPEVRNFGGRSKALVRSMLARRFPHLGFERQGKRLLGTFIDSVTSAEVGRASRALGPRSVLGELGGVDGGRVRAFLEDPPSGKGWRVWDLLNLEAWARAHSR